MLNATHASNFSVSLSRVYAGSVPVSLSLSLSLLFSGHTPPDNLPLPTTIADQFACSAPDTGNDVQTAPAHIPTSASLGARYSGARRQSMLPSSSASAASESPGARRQSMISSGKSRRSSVFSEIENNKARVLWAKALWWATQEAKRRKALQKALQIQSAEMQNAFAISMTAGGGNLPPAGLHESDVYPNTSKLTSATNFNPVIPGNTQNGTPGPQSIAFQSHLVASMRKGVGSFQAWLHEDNATTAARKNSQGTESTGDSTRGFPPPGLLTRGVSGTLGTSANVPDVLQEEEGIVLRTLHHRYWTWCTIFCMVWVLVGRDVYQLLDPPVSADRPVYSLFVICALQIVIHFLLIPYDRGYFLGFYFWLDVSVFCLS